MARSLRPFEVFPITTRELSVLRVADVTPGMRRVTLGGERLAAHTAENGMPVAAFRSDGFDDEFKLFFKHPDLADALVPEQADGVINWPRRDEQLLFRTYTVRRWDAAAGELDIDFVRHGTGPAATWAETVRPGEHLHIAGPKMSSGHPIDADWTLVAGDETALPAIGRWLEQWPSGARGQVFIEVAESTHRQELTVPPGVDVTWLSRDGAEPGSTTLLFDALRAADWWPGEVFAWVAGEALTLTPIRRWLRDEHGLDRSHLEVTGYWRRQGATEAAASGGDEVELELEADDDERFHELAELLPAFALRVAASIGLAAAFDGAERTPAELAAATGADPTGLVRLLRYLEVLGLAERTGTSFRLSPLGRSLEDDHVAAELDLNGAVAQRELGGALSLLAAVRTGRGDHERWFGTDHRNRVLADATLLAATVEEHEADAVYVADALADAAVFAGLGSLALLGRGAGTLAESLVAAHAALRVAIVAAPSELEVIGRLHPAHPRIALEPGSPLVARGEPSDAVLLADALTALADADAVHALRQATAGACDGRVLVFGDALELARAYEHDLEHDLIEFALSGGGERTHDELVALFDAAGLQQVRRDTIGWGYSLYELAPRA